jgi:uncharacterized protein (TIGR00106 family)
MIALISVAPEDHWEHMSSYIADAVRLLKESGLFYEVGPMGTTIEGEPEQVFEIMKRMHLEIRKKSKRVSTLIKIDDQVNRPTGRMREKVKAVEDKI